MRFSAVIGGAARPMCCAGCAAVARAIAEGGLSAYYETRSAPARRETSARKTRDLEVYDMPEVQEPFVRQSDGGLFEATLLVEGITCGACVWLIESGLARCEGVREASVNLAARRLHVQWDGSRTRLSAILDSLEALGYRASGFDAATSESVAVRERRRMVWRLFVAGLGMMQVMMYAVPSYLADGDMGAGVEQLMRWSSLVLTTPVVLFSAGPLFAGAWRAVRQGRVVMDVPVALGIAIAFAASAWATASGHGAVYFDSITMFVFLLLGARYLERIALARAEELRLRIARGTPAVADRIVPGSVTEATERVPSVRLAPGDLVRVTPGAVIPADGTIAEGTSKVDESLLTGEPTPIAKRAGDAVVCGSVNLVNPLTLSVTRAGADSTLAAISRLLDRAVCDRPRLSRAADRAAQRFVVAQLVLALVAGLAWCWVDPARALGVVVAVLVVSCPCALSLATPAALAAATGTLHGLGLLVTRGRALETLAQVTHVIVDKTGTLTRGRLTLTSVTPLGALDRESCLALAATLERGSEHAIAAPLLAAAVELRASPISNLRNFPGRGVEGVVNGARVRLGSPAFAAEIARAELPHRALAGHDAAAVAVLADERGYLAVVTFGDVLRPGAHGLVRSLQATGKRVCILSGDRASAVGRLARELSVDMHVSEASPAGKLEFVRRLQSSGAIVAMIGDGINDAPVLGQAHVSIAMGGGTDLAQSKADVVLLGDELRVLPAAFDVARRTMRIVRQNLAWAAAYNAIAIPVAVAGWISPLAAGVGMALSSLLVAANALRLTRSAAIAGERPGRSAVPALAVPGE